MNSWKLIRDKAERGTFIPDRRVWNKIESRLAEHDLSMRKKFRFRVGWMAAAIAAIVSFYIFFTAQTEVPYYIETLTSDQNTPHQRDVDVWIHSDYDLRFHKKGRLIPNYQLISKSPLIINNNS